MVFSDFVGLFTKVYQCRVFPDEDYRQYCIHGESNKDEGHLPKLRDTVFVYVVAKERV